MTLSGYIQTESLYPSVSSLDIQAGFHGNTKSSWHLSGRVLIQEAQQGSELH